MDNKKEMQVELTPEVIDGVYSNLAIIGHSASEFILDFLRLVPGAEKAKVKSRVIMTPDNVKRLMIALEDNVRKYESMFGEIDLRGNTPGMPTHFDNMPD